jgi:hypothetical protein
MGKKFSSPSISSTLDKRRGYRNNTAYLITIYTVNEGRYFGSIVDGKMRLSPIGMIAYAFWHKIMQGAGFIKLGKFAVMPNYVCGILIVDKSSDTGATDTIENTVSSIICRYKSAVSRQAYHIGYGLQWQPHFYIRIIKNNDKFYAK